MYKYCFRIISVQAGHFAVEVGRIPTNFIQDNPILQAILLQQYCYNTLFFFYIIQHYIFILIVILVSGYTRIHSFATITFCFTAKGWGFKISRYFARVSGRLNYLPPPPPSSLHRPHSPKCHRCPLRSRSPRYHRR